MNSYPKVSIFLPTYNHEDFLAECLQSVLSQGYPNLEIVCSDDCSLDNTTKILEDYRIQYPKEIIALYAQNNLGMVKNFNKILKHCTGKYIIFFSGDDIMLPHKIFKLVSLMENNPAYVLGYHDLEVFDSYSGNKICNYSHIAQPPKEEVESLLKPGTFVVGPAVIARKKALPESGFNESLNVLADWLLLIETATNGKIGYIPEVLSRYRRHFGNISNKTSHYQEYFCALGILRSKYIKLSSHIRYYEGHVFAGFLANYLRAAEYDNAFICAKEAFIRLYRPYLMGLLCLLNMVRYSIFKVIIDNFIARLFKFLDERRKDKLMNYKLYSN